eukprot:m.91757 g.91757  ORF g.91757 m.91757 type:complete len:216 (+) comp16511_c0_seq2:155-802(+)
MSSLVGDEDEWHRASYEGDERAVRQYLKRNPGDVNALSGGATALQLACSQGHLDIVKYLVEEAMADIDLQGPFLGVGTQTTANDEVEEGTIDKVTALGVAARRGHTAVVSYLLSKGADVNLPMARGVTPLTTAVAAGHTNVVSELLATEESQTRACNVNQVEEDGWSALMIACLQGREEIAKILVKAGADRNVVANDGTSLANAVVAVRNTVVTA